VGSDVQKVIVVWGTLLALKMRTLCWSIHYRYYVMGCPYFPFIHYEFSRHAAARRDESSLTHRVHHYSYENARIISQMVIVNLV